MLYTPFVRSKVKPEPSWTGFRRLGHQSPTQPHELKDNDSKTKDNAPKKNAKAEGPFEGESSKQNQDKV